MEPITVLASDLRTARKAHHCSVLNCHIAPGDKYTDSRCVCDGRVYTFRICQHCQEWAEAIEEQWHENSWHEEFEISGPSLTNWLYDCSHFEINPKTGNKVYYVKQGEE